MNKQKFPKLIDVAQACMNGACNSFALIRSFGNAVEELAPGAVRQNPAVKVCLGHISYLCGESLGPTAEAMNEFETWATQ